MADTTPLSRPLTPPLNRWSMNDSGNNDNAQTKRVNQKAEYDAQKAHEAKIARQKAVKAQQQAGYQAAEAERDRDQAQYEAHAAEIYRQQVEDEAYEANQKAIQEDEFRRLYRAFAVYYDAYYDAFRAFGALAEFEGSDDWPGVVDPRMVNMTGNTCDWNELCMDCLRRRWTGLMLETSRRKMVKVRSIRKDHLVLPKAKKVMVIHQPIKRDPVPYKNLMRFLQHQKVFPPQDRQK
ncbi:hypothetical protein MCOR25_007448 [Pyricularia grisea]|nr:hypothetical protein MCOR25_007448 [Pyricularia grisea]